MNHPILIWNIRGIGNNKSIRCIKSHLRINCVQLACIIEPKVAMEKMDPIRQRLQFDSVVANNDDNAKIWLFWNNCLDVQILQRNEQFITIQLQNGGGGEFIITFVYASCDRSVRRTLYQELQQFGGYLQKPWMLGGDFNAILSPEEKKGGTMGFINSLIEFQEFVARAGLLDAGYSGNPFTWTNNQKGARNVKARLDRILHNDKWVEEFPTFTVQHLIREPSDHCPLIVKQHNLSAGIGRFVIQNMWFEDDSFHDLVRSAWISNDVNHSNAIVKLQHKLKAIKPVIKQWNSEKFGNIFDGKRLALEEVEQSELNFDNNPSESNRSSLQAAQAKFRRALHLEELYWGQKAKVNWLQTGDRNTKFYHLYVQQRRARMAIHRMKTEDGQWCEDEVILKDQAVDFYKK